MADEKKPELKVGDTIELIAVERGFRRGKMVEPGQKFMAKVIAGKDGKPRLPKWAQPADQPLPKKDAKKNGDLKPADTQAALADKQKGLANGTPGPTGQGANALV